MTHTKVRRCAAAGCRTLTASHLCKKCQIADDELLDSIDAEIAADRLKAQHAAAQAEQERDAASAARKQRDELHTELRSLLAGLRRVAGKNDKPVFAEVPHG